LEAERSWALTLIRVDYWHTYQEVYGDMATAQVMRTLAQLLLQHIQPPDFLGHATETNTLILITPAPKAQRLMKALCQEFDAWVPECYSTTDKKRGYLIAQTTERASRRIPLMSLSAGIVRSVTQTGGQGRNSYRQAFAEATHLMSLAQRSHGSTWVADAVKLAGGTQSEAPKAPPRVLVVESDEALSMLLVATLEMQGYTVATATTPNAVLAEITSTHTDLVLMDALLNEAEVGWELCQQIKTIAPNTQVLLLATIHDRERALQCGADVYLPKPFDLFALFNTLEQLLR
jgi:CheY-like chemotaxis protein